MLILPQMEPGRHSLLRHSSYALLGRDSYGYCPKVVDRRLRNVSGRSRPLDAAIDYGSDIKTPDFSPML
jgi:hypothetical protein